MTVAVYFAFWLCMAALFLVAAYHIERRAVRDALKDVIRHLKGETRWPHKTKRGRR
jgi:hypothetical protein